MQMQANVAFSVLVPFCLALRRAVQIVRDETVDPLYSTSSTGPGHLDCIPICCGSIHDTMNCQQKTTTALCTYNYR